MSKFKSMPVGKQSQRLGSFPLDSTFIHNDREAAKAYASASPVAYEGQIIYAVDGRWPAEIERNEAPYGCLFMITKQRQLLQLNAKSFEANEYASETFVSQKISELVNSAPETLDTLKELANALGNDENFAQTILEKLAGKADKDHLHDDRYLMSNYTKDTNEYEDLN